MKIKLLIVLLLFVQVGMFAQEVSSNRDSIYKPILPINKQNLLKDIDVIFNMRFAFDNEFLNGVHENSQFNNNQFRIEVKGKILDKVSFRFRNRYTKMSSVESRDNISGSVDMAYVGVDVSPNLVFNLGKMSADWGGYESDLNAIDALQYNDIINNSDSFLTGVGATYQVLDNHKLGFQVLNARTKNFEEQYEDKIPLGIEKVKVPLAYTVSWRGRFFDGKLETIYSYSYFQEAKNRGMNYYALGNKFENKGLKVMYDFKYSHEGIDRKGIVTGFIEGNDKFMAQDVAYLENWLRVECMVTPKIYALLTLMTGNAYGKNVSSSGVNHLRTSYGYIPSIEYKPFAKINIRFYLSYVGRNYKFSEFVQQKLGQTNYDTGRVSFGFIAPLLVF